MSNFWKSFKIQTTIIVFSLILANIFGHIFYSRGVYTVAGMASWIPGLAMGLYILFGKYAYFRGDNLQKKKTRWLIGLFVIFMVPIFTLASMSAERFERERRERQADVLRTIVSRPRQQQLDALYDTLLQHKSIRTEEDEWIIEFGRNMLMQMLDEIINDPDINELDLRHAMEMLDRLNEAN